MLASGEKTGRPEDIVIRSRRRSRPPEAGKDRSTTTATITVDGGQDCHFHKVSVGSRGIDCFANKMVEDTLASSRSLIADGRKR